MTAFKTMTLALTIGLFSCSGNDSAPKNSDNTKTDTTAVVPQNTTSAALVDSSGKLDVDDYPVTDEMFSSSSNNSNFARKSGVVYSHDKAWFTNAALKQTLVFDLYTDWFRSTTYHFYNEDIPRALISRMELSTEKMEPASLSEKEKAFDGFVNTATKIDGKFFTSKKGFQLGDSKQKALGIYGNPDSTAKEGGVEILHWAFTGDQLYDGKTDLKGKPLVKDNYGHQIVLFFRNDKLIAIILNNDIP